MAITIIRFVRFIDFSGGAGIGSKMLSEYFPSMFVGLYNKTPEQVKEIVFNFPIYNAKDIIQKIYIPYRLAKFISFFLKFFTGFRFRKFLKKFDKNKVILHFHHLHFFYPLVKVAEDMGYIVLVTVHQELKGMFPILKKIAKLNHAKSKCKFVVFTNDTLNIFNSKFPNLFVKKICNAVSISHVMNSTDEFPKLQKGVFSFGCVSRLNPEKGIDILIKAFRVVINNSNSDLKLFIIGKGPLFEELTSLIDDLNLKNNVFLLGYVDNVKEFFSHIDVYVQPSRREAFGRALIEATYFGKICVASDIPGNREVLGSAGVYFESENVSALAQTLLDIYNSFEKYKHFGDLAKKRSTFFSEEAFIENYRDLYTSLIK
ncbi:MAG: glycosyltransferase family 4 protein [Ignavibacteria bacterium]|nr:glycosyltransferase family 4 protein [Ignavibacteria bacterium]